MLRNSGRWGVPLAFVCLLGLTAYGTTWNAAFLLWDDAAYVYRNAAVTQPDPIQALKVAFGSFQCSNYHPLTVLSHWAVYQAVGDNPSLHHLVNVFLHCLNSFLVFLLLRTLGLPTAYGLFAASVFAVHPMNVSAVAWVAERKEVLCAFFFLSAVVVWLRARRGLGLATAVLCGGLALLSKPTAVSLPLVLGAAELTGVSGSGYRRGRWLAILLLGIGAVLIGGLTLEAQAATAIHEAPVARRFASAMHSLGWYFTKLLAPAGLSPHHVRAPHWDNWDVHALGGMTLLVGMILVGFFAMRAAWNGVAWGFIWFLVVWLPVSGVVRVGLAPVAERYMYIAQIGLWVGLLSGVARLIGGIQAAVSPVRWPVWGTAAAAAIGMVLVFFGRCVEYASVWQDDERLWQHVLRHYPGSGLARVNLAAYYAQVAGNEDAAVRLLKQVRPEDPDGQYKLAQLNLLILKTRTAPLDPVLLGRMEQLLDEPPEKDNRLVCQALVAARARAARIALQRGQYRTALLHCERGLRVSPGDAGLLYLQALAYRQLGQEARAQDILRFLEGNADTPEPIRNAVRGTLRAYVR